MKQLYLLKLIRSKVLNRREIHSILKKDPNLEKISSLSPQKITHFFDIPLKIARKIKNCLQNDTLTTQIKSEYMQCKIITIFDKNYPLLLKKIVDAPLVLYVMGDESLLNTAPIISVIGTRQPTHAAWEKLNHIITPLIKKDWVIVSGLAKGIDSFAHQLTLNNNGKTISVLGHGFNYTYPAENRGLFQLIKNRGLIVTEYPPNTPPKKYQFPERNRIISGLSLATLVIEAKERSGTLITVNQALEQGRDVYAVPDSPLISEAQGCLEMIQDGAQLVINATDILNNWTYEW